MVRSHAAAWMVGVAGIAWLILPVTVGDALDVATAGDTEVVRWTVAAGAWLGWGGGIVCGLLPLPITLTGMRILAPAAAAAAFAALAGGEPSGTAIAGVAAAVLATGCVFASPVGHRHVNGASYAGEERFPLRAPALTALVLAPVAWAVLVGSVGVAAIGLARGELGVGLAAAVAGVAAIAIVPRALHALARRWLVLVPAGVVLHDPLTLADPFLFRRETVRAIEPATPGDACDLTAGAAGLAVRLTLHTPAPLARRSRRGRQLETTNADAVLFTPVRPGLLLRAVNEPRRPR